MSNKKVFSHFWIDRIPSKDMRDHLKKLNYKFTDLQLATIICKFLDLKWQEQRYWLRELAEVTEDERIRERILEFLKMEEEEIERFKILCPGWLYELEIRSMRNSKYNMSVFGFYDSFESAWGAGISSGKMFDLKKIKLQTKAEADNEISEEDMKESSSWLSFYEDGSIQYTRRAESDFWEKYNDTEDNFMGQYFYVPTPFYMGDVVHDIARDKYGIIMHGVNEREKWKYHQDILKRGGDYTDIQVRLNIFEDGEWIGHIHSTPFDLEFVDAEDEVWKVNVMRKIGELG